ncbi:MAG: CHAT domain-containing protein [Alphaproteobacteria bacterium]|nr:CHAT domain-containing protein [Alphaproteobacteria bacterium]
MRTSAIILLLALGLCLAAAQEGRAQGGNMALPGLQMQAAQGDADAMVKLGEIYRLGDQVPVNMALAMNWYEKAAEAGNVGGLYLTAFFTRQRRDPEAYRKAEDYITRALAICAATPQDFYCASPHLWLELAYSQSGQSRLNDALQSADRALAIATAASPPDENAMAQIYQVKGDTLVSIGDYEEAIVFLEKARDLFAAKFGPDDINVGSVIISLGMTYQRMGQPEKAIATDKIAFALFEKAAGVGSLYEGVLHNNTGWALKSAERYQEAYAEFEKAIPILSKHFGPQSGEVSYPMTNMGIIREKQGRHAEAIRLNLKALVIQSRLRSAMLEPMRWTLQSLSSSYRALGQKANAVLFAKLAVNTHQEIRSLNSGLDERRARTLAREWPNIYYELADLLVEDGRVAEAQFVLDLLKQQELVEFVRRDSASQTTSEQTSLTTREQDTAAALSAAMERPMALARELEGLLAKQQADPLDTTEQQRAAAINAELDQSYESFVTSVEGVLTNSGSEAPDVQAEIAALNLEYAADRQEMLRGFARPTALLQAASLGDGLNLFLTTKDISIHRRVAITRSDLSRKVFDALTDIESRNPGADQKLMELHDLLIGPIEQHLRDSGTEVIMLNLGGFLRYLPFAALKSQRGYLIEDYAIVIDTPAAQTRFEPVDRKGSDAAGFGVTAAHPGFSPLPGVAKELEAIFEGTDARGELSGAPLLDKAFTADTLRDALRRRPKLLHVASHFKFVPGNETDSFLLLGDGAPLTLAQIRKGRGFRFGGVDLLTLSACETAKGGDGDEVESFGAIAQMNGASAVMATLWPIADDASARLMADFYAGLIESKLDKADSLCRAQIAMLRGVNAGTVNLTQRAMSDPEAEPAQTPAIGDSRHPYYWSPYILMGNWL